MALWRADKMALLSGSLLIGSMGLLREGTMVGEMKEPLEGTIVVEFGVDGEVVCDTEGEIDSNKEGNLVGDMRNFVGIMEEAAVDEFEIGNIEGCYW
eukprot:15232275-Ditylum_brightwellii.AAC.1